MLKLINSLEKKVDMAIIAFLGNGIILFLLGTLVILTDFMVRVVVGILIFIISYTFLFGAYKLWSLKDEIKRYLS
jgi:hypothetical protein